LYVSAASVSRSRCSNRTPILWISFVVRCKDPEEREVKEKDRTHRHHRVEKEEDNRKIITTYYD
jgi:hypothetical protein